MTRTLSILSSLILTLGTTSSWGAPAESPPPVAPAASTQGEITVTRPVIPDSKFNLADFGAVGDFKTMNTEAFKNAVAAVSKAGGGHLIVPPGIYKTLPFTLASHMDLHLEPGAVIKAPERLEEYGIADPNLPLPATATSGRAVSPGTGAKPPSLISAANVTDIAITGSGTIDGSGAIFWIWSDKASRRYPAGRRVLARPHLVSLSGQRIHVDGVTITNSPNFHLVPRGQDILIENVRIVAPSDAPNSDAMDPGGQRIIIRNCEIDTGDDNVAIQNGSRDVLVEDITCLHGHGISIGSSTRNGLSHIVVRRCTFNGTDNGLRIKSYRGSGGEVRDIQYSDITMRNVRRPIDLNMLYNGNADAATDVGVRQARPDQTQSIPNFHDIHFTNITVTRSPVAGRIVGLPEQLANNITFSNVKIQSVRGLLLQDAKDITFTNTQITPAIGDPLVLDNGSATWNGTPKSGSTKESTEPFFIDTQRLTPDGYRTPE